MIRPIVIPATDRGGSADLSKVSKCIRTYSVDNGLDAVPELASRVGLKVMLGIWLGRDRIKNALLIDSAISVVKATSRHRHGDHRRQRSAAAGGNDRRPTSGKPSVRSGPAWMPVSYADVWEFWLRYREVAAEVDFVTAHILPYWEDFPIRAEHAAAHVHQIRRRVAVAFPDKEILIGETGWPSKGRMRDGALPSRISQARFISGILERSRQQNFRVNFFEAYDEPWKVQWEGTVGGQWGLFDGGPRVEISGRDADRQLSVLEAAVGGGMVLGIAVFGVAFWTLRRRAVAAATGVVDGGGDIRHRRRHIAGTCCGKGLHESYGFGGGLLQGAVAGHRGGRAAVGGPCVDVGTRACRLLSKYGAAGRPRSAVDGDDSRHHADRNHRDRSADRAKPGFRSTLARFPIRRADHGGRYRF